MAIPVIMPKQGLQMTEGTIMNWLVEEGAPIREGDPFFEMETDKLTITIDAPATGTLLKIVHGEGDTVPVAALIAVIGEPGEDIGALLGDSKPESPTQNLSRPEPVNPLGTAPQQTIPAAAPSPAVSAGGRVFITPRARMQAEEKNISIREIAPTGPDGLIIERDVLAAASSSKAQPAPAPAPAPSVPPPVSPQIPLPEGTLLPLTGMRRAVAGNMMRSLHETAQAVHRLEVDMTACAALREKLKATGRPGSYNEFILMAAARALGDFPIMNSRWTPEGILLISDIHIGMAVALEGGLMVPVIRHTDRLSLGALGDRCRDLAGRTREGALSPDEYTGGTFTVSNLGKTGITDFTAVLNPPETGILAVGSIAKRPVVEGDRIVPRLMVTLSLTYDHRVVDGEPAARFLTAIGRYLQDPALMMI